MTIGERIKQARKVKGFTQKQLGEVSRTSETTVKQYELGKRQPRLEQLQRIAVALDVPIAELAELPGSIAAELPADVQRVARSMEQLNDEGREKVVDYADDLAQSGKYIKTGQSGMGQKQA